MFAICTVFSVSAQTQLSIGVPCKGYSETFYKKSQEKPCGGTLFLLGMIIGNRLGLVIGIEWEEGSKGHYRLLTARDESRRFSWFLFVKCYDRSIYCIQQFQNLTKEKSYSLNQVYKKCFQKFWNRCIVCLWALKIIS